MKNSEITLHPLQDIDIGLLTSSLNKDYILKWYHNADEWLDEVNG